MAVLPAVVENPQPGDPFLELNDLVQEPGIDLDLNQVVQEDLGGIEDLFQLQMSWRQIL